MRTKPGRAVTSGFALPHMRATTSRSSSQSQRRAPVQCLAVSDYCCSATVWPAAMVREDGDMRPRVTASKNSIAAAADATAIVRVKSDTGVPSHVIPSTEFFEKMRFQFVRGRLNCASIGRTNRRSCRQEGCRRRDQARVASGRSSCEGRARNVCWHPRAAPHRDARGRTASRRSAHRATGQSCERLNCLSGPRVQSEPAFL